MTHRSFNLRSALLCAVGLTVLCFAPPGLGQQSNRTLRYDQYMGGGQMLQTFKPLVADAHHAVVSIRCDNRIRAFGTVVREDGYLITKASEISGQIECEFADGRRLTAQLVAQDPQTDLALLRVDATGLTPIPWQDPEALTRAGQWAITASHDALPLAVGVVSVPNRSIANRLFLGFLPQNQPDGQGVRVLRVTPGLGAAEAGLERNDIITHINDDRVASREQITQSVLGLGDGASIRVRIDREGTTQEFNVALTAAKDPDLRNMQGQRSARDYGFQEVIQHDTHLSPRDCGGPLLNSQGRAIGINIARAGRVASYALPTKVVQPAIQRLLDRRDQPAHHHKASKRIANPGKAVPGKAVPGRVDPGPGKPHTKPYLIKALGFETAAQRTAF